MTFFVGTLVVISLYVLLFWHSIGTPRWTRADRGTRTSPGYPYLTITSRTESEGLHPYFQSKLYRTSLLCATSKGCVQMREKGRRTLWLCLQTNECMPDDDQVVIHTFLIEANEEAYLQTAKLSRSFSTGCATRRI